jgi:hypothetical protein
MSSWSTGRIGFFLSALPPAHALTAPQVGCGSGSAMYYACDAYMLRDFGRAQKRATEVRDELIGVVKAPVNDAKEKLSSTVLSPLGSAKDGLKNSWNESVTKVFSKAPKPLQLPPSAPATPAAPAPASPPAAKAEEKADE